MGNGIACCEFDPSDLIETTSVVPGLAEELVLLVVGVLVEDAHAVIGIPTEKQILIDIDSRFFGGLFEGGVKDYLILLRNLEVLLLDGTGCHQRDGHPDV